MSSFTWKLTDTDRELFENELEGFIPPRVYDIHTHLYRTKFWEKSDPRIFAGPSDVTIEVWKNQMEWILPGRELHGIYFPLAFVNDTMPGNEWVSEQIKKDPYSQGHFLVKPTDDPEWVRQQVRRLGLHGLKPFSSYVDKENIWEAEIPEYLPEPLMSVANEEGWTITLHIVRYEGIADKSNQHWLRYYCKKYPNAHIIVDHGARGFNPYQVIRGLPELKELDNLWFNTSAIISSLALEAIIKIIGHKKMLYASDYCISHFRGTIIYGGNDFMWLYEDSPIWDTIIHGKQVHAPLIGLENLRAAKAACWAAGLSDTQVEDYFWGNAANLLGIE